MKHLRMIDGSEMPGEDLADETSESTKLAAVTILEAQLRAERLLAPRPRGSDHRGV
jgi:hypothetical protein